MPITEKQRLRRAKCLGSSDMAAVLGVDPYKTAYDVWLQKTGRVESPPANAAMDAGNILERSVLDFAERDLGKLKRNQYRALPEAHLGANIDAIVVSGGEPVEAKTSGMIHLAASENWGEAGTDEVPERVIIQTHVHMLVTQSAVCHVPALLGGRGFVYYRVPFDAELGQVITTEAVAFWERVVSDTPPEGSPSLQCLKRRQRTPNAIARDLRPDLLQAWLDTAAIAKQAKEAHEAAEAALLAAIGDAEAATFEGLPDALTYYEIERGEYFCKATKYRKLIHKRKGLLSYE